MNNLQKIIIIGAGPTGLGAGYNLYRLKHSNWKIFEKNEYIGGLSASFKDSKGFIWDIGGHVIHSHYTIFDVMLKEMLNNEYLLHKRESWIKVKNNWVPYPFQNNIRYLTDKKMLYECLIGLINASNSNKDKQPSLNFKEWIVYTFGKGIAKYFMLPYNFKVWAYPLEKMDTNWIKERVSVVDVERVLKNIIFEKDDVSWGPNNKFIFPLYGGTGEIYRRIASIFNENIYLNNELTEVNYEKKYIVLSDGKKENYDVLINTSPINEFFRKLVPINSTIRNLIKISSKLKYNSILIVGIGLEKRLNDSKCWMYFPGKESPFFRATFFSNYSPNNVPGGDVSRFSSIMCDISFSKYKKEDKNTIIDRTINGLINVGLLKESDKKLIVSKFLIEKKYGYPIPTKNRDKILDILLSFLESQGIFSRGRFGIWKYEIGNMDHCFMQGYEIIDRIINNKEEKVINGK